MASQRSLMSRSAALAALRSPIGRMASASAASTSLSFWFSTCSASRSLNTAERAWKKTSWAPRNRAHSSSSMSRWARPADFQRVIRSRYAAAVSPHSVEPDSASASATSFSLAARAWSRSASRVAKCALRCLEKTERACEKRCHSSSSLLRSRRGSAFQVSTRARSRSPASRHWVDSASCSASATSLSLAVRVSSCALARATLRSSRRDSMSALSVSRRLASASRSPTACASTTCVRRCSRAAWASLAARSVVRTRFSSRPISTAMPWYLRSK